MSTASLSLPRGRAPYRSTSRSVYCQVEVGRARKRRQPTGADSDGTLPLSSSAPSLSSAAATAACTAAFSAAVGERPVMATVCAMVATAPLSSSSSSCPSFAASSPSLSDSSLTAAVVLSAPPPRWMARSNKRSKEPILAAPWSRQSHASFGDWMSQHDGASASPASSTSTSSTSSAASVQAAHPTHMHRRSSLPSFSFPLSSSPASPNSGCSVSSTSNHSFAVPSGPTRLQSAPSAMRNLSRFPTQPSNPPNPPSESSPGSSEPSSSESSAEVAVVAGSINKFENLQLRLAAHPAIQRLQQLDEARTDQQQQVKVEEEDEDDDDDEDEHEAASEPEQQLCPQQVKYELTEDVPMMPMYGEMLSALPMSALPVVDEAEHAPLAGLVTAFPFVQQFMPQPSRAEKKKLFIDRMHASHQLTIVNHFSPTSAIVTRTIAPRQAALPVARLSVEQYHAPLPAVLPGPFRSIPSSPTLSSDDCQEELSSEHDSCEQTDCSSSALADTFAGLSPNFLPARPSTGFPFPPPLASSAPFFLSPVLSSSSGPHPIFHSPVLHTLPPVFASPALLSSSDSSLCPDDLQLGERAWDDGHWMGDW